MNGETAIQGRVDSRVMFRQKKKQKLSFAVSRVTQRITGCIDPVLSLLNRLPGDAKIHLHTLINA